MAFLVGDPIDLRHPRRDVLACDVAPNQTLIATATQTGAVHLWEAATGREIEVLQGAHTKAASAVSFNGDGTALASCSLDSTLVVWDLADITARTARRGPAKVRYRCLQGHGPGIGLLCCVFSADSALLASGGKDCDVMLWGHLGLPVCRRLRNHSNWVLCACFARTEPFLATGGADHAVSIWSTTRFALVGTIRRHRAAVNAVHLSAEGSVVTSGDAHGAVFISRADGTVMRELKGHRDAITGVRMSERTGLIITVSHDMALMVWSLRGSCVRSFKVHEGLALSMCVDLDESFVCTTGDDFLARVWPYRWDPAGEELIE